MGMFDQFKMAADMMKGMSPDQIKQLMEQAKNSQKVLEDQSKRVVDEEIKKRDLISREEAMRLLARAKFLDKQS